MNLQDAWTFNLAGSYDFGFMKTYLATQYFKDARDAGSVLDYVGFFDEDSVFNNNEGDVKFKRVPLPTPAMACISPRRSTFSAAR